MRFYRNVTCSLSEETEPFKSELEKLRSSNQTLKKTMENTHITWSDLSKIFVLVFYEGQIYSWKSFVNQKQKSFEIFTDKTLNSKKILKKSSEN